MTIIISKEGTYHQNRGSGGGTRLVRIGKGIRELAEDDAQKMKRSSNTSIPSEQKNEKNAAKLPSYSAGLLFRIVRNEQHGVGVIVDVDDDRRIRVVFQSDPSTIRTYFPQDLENNAIELVNDSISPFSRNPTPETEKDALTVHQRLGNLTYRCQRIEWLLKWFLDHASNKSTTDSNDSLETIVTAYLDSYYSVNRVDSKASFNKGLTRSLREKIRNDHNELYQNFIDSRNWLIHSFGLEYDLTSQEACAKALDKLKEINAVIKATEISIEADCHLFKKIFGISPQDTLLANENP